MKIMMRTLALFFLLLTAGAIAFYLHPLWFNEQHIRFGLWHHGVESKYVEASGYRVHYFEAPSAQSNQTQSNQGPGIPLVLVHGLGSSGEDWAALIPQFAANGFHVYVPDLLGYGRTARPDVDYSISIQEKLVADFMKAVGLPHADVVGWSMGGWVAAKLALDHPQLVDRLVLYDSAGLYFGNFDTEIFVPADAAGLDRLNAILQPAPPKIPAFAARDAVRMLQANAWVVRRSVNSMTSGRDLLDFRLQSLHKPTLIIWGGKDTLIPVSVGESMHHLIAGSSFVVAEECGHLAPVQCASVVFPATLDFLKSSPPSRSIKEASPAE